MKKDNFDTILKQALTQKANNIEAPSLLLQKIKCEIQHKEEKNMKFFSPKKLLILGVICIASVSCYAAATAKSYSSHSSRDNEFPSFPTQETLDKDLGFTTKYLEELPGGYRFTSGNIGTTASHDDSGETLETTKELHLTYEKEDISLSFSARPLLLGETTELFAEQPEYSEMNYMFVPPDYELTEEDKEKEANGELTISYGSSEVEHNVVKSIVWLEDSIVYTLLGFDIPLEEAEFSAMVNAINEQ